jgi:hypothetical protein
MTVPKTSAGQFCMFFVAELLAYFIIVANTRAFTHGLYFWTAITDAFFSAQQFFFAKLMIDDPAARSWASGAGCVLGGTCGSLIAIWVTKTLYGV